MGKKQDWRRNSRNARNIWSQSHSSQGQEVVQTQQACHQQTKQPPLQQPNTNQTNARSDVVSPPAALRDTDPSSKHRNVVGTCKNTYRRTHPRHKFNADISVIDRQLREGRGRSHAAREKMRLLSLSNCLMQHRIPNHVPRGPPAGHDHNNNIINNNAEEEEALDGLVDISLNIIIGELACRQTVRNACSVTLASRPQLQAVYLCQRGECPSTNRQARGETHRETAEALKCYACDSTKIPQCTSISKAKSDHLLKQCPPNNACIKAVLKDSDGKQVIARDCIENNHDEVKTFCTKVSTLFRDAKCETCETDGCNGAKVTMPVISSLIISVYFILFVCI
ncbi:hypothetical protein B566_EDAN008757 [Ephemera danica]|nr:hypothetical protein B566_EDAN008757 [Ephemera danica]